MEHVHPLDLSRNGEQVIPLIGSNMFYIGNVRLIVGDGSVRVISEPLPGVTVRREFMTFFGSLDEVSTINPRELTSRNIPFGTPVSIADGLEGDTRVLLYVNLVVDYPENLRGIQRFMPRHDR